MPEMDERVHIPLDPEEALRGLLQANPEAAPVTAVLLDKWDDMKRHRRGECPKCGGDVSTIAITKIVYTHAACACGVPEFVHLVEVLWHRACYEPLVCEDFVAWPAPKAGRYYRDHADECYVCGRTHAAHEVAPSS